MVASRKVGSLYRAQCFLTPEYILYLYKSTIQRYGVLFPYLGAPSSHALGLLDQVQKRVVSLVVSGLSSDFQALSHRRDVAGLSLSYKYYCGKCSSELVDLVPPKFVTVRTLFSEQMHHHTVNSPICWSKFYQSSFFPHTAVLSNSLMNAFHQSMISQHSKGELTSSCWRSVLCDCIKNNLKNVN